jgi:AcrR family transcriptional regulator
MKVEPSAENRPAPAPAPAPAAGRRRRMSPEERRHQIIDTARRLYVERPGQAISTADVAAAAGVTRALIHHYFRGIEELRHAVSMTIAESTPRILARGLETPVQERVRENVRSLLDVVDANRHVWLATLAGEGASSWHPNMPEQVREVVVLQMLANNSDLIEDTPWTRLCLNGFLGFGEMICRDWILGQATRESAEQAMFKTLLVLLTEVIPGGPSA